MIFIIQYLALSTLDKVSDMALESERLQPDGNEETKSKVGSLLTSVRFTQRKLCSLDSTGLTEIATMKCPG